LYLVETILVDNNFIELSGSYFHELTFLVKLSALLLGQGVRVRLLTLTCRSSILSDKISTAKLSGDIDSHDSLEEILPFMQI
jgi:hypothetical protein